VLHQVYVPTIPGHNNRRMFKIASHNYDVKIVFDSQCIGVMLVHVGHRPVPLPSLCDSEAVPVPADALPSSAGSEAAINRIEDLIAQWWVCVVYTRYWNE